jgi:hypothetical protein
MPTTIAEQVSHPADTTTAQPPNEIMGAFTREQADLAARGAPAGLIEVGTRLPDAELLDAHGATTSLYAALGGSLSTLEKNKLTFTVLSDLGNQVAKAAGILTAPSDEARAAQLQLGLDLAAVNADGTTGLPMPTTMIVDADHVIGWIDVHPDYTARSEPSEILAALDAAACR